MSGYTANQSSAEEIDHLLASEYPPWYGRNVRIREHIEALRAERDAAREALRKFIAFQGAGYLAGQPFESTYAILVREARAALPDSPKQSIL